MINESFMQKIDYKINILNKFLVTMSHLYDKSKFRSNAAPYYICKESIAVKEALYCFAE